MQKQYDTCRRLLRESSKDVSKAIRLLRHLADLQNGPPLVMYEDEWTNTMKEVYEFLDEKEKDYLTAADQAAQ